MPEKGTTKSDIVIAAATDNFLGGLSDVEDILVKELEKIIKSLNSQGGQILPKDAFNKKVAQQLDQKIVEILKKTGYDSQISDLLTNFDEVERNAAQLQLDFSDLKVDFTKLNIGDLRKWAIDSAAYYLKEGGFKFNVIQPIKDALTRTVILGGNLTDLETQVRATVGNTLKSYTGQTVRDLFSQYEGVVQKKIETVYDLNAILYIGGIKQTSRPQCKRWVKMGTILIKDLPEEIAWAERNGSGMIPDTTPDTFTIYRGGFGCLHKAIPTRR